MQILSPTKEHPEWHDPAGETWSQEGSSLSTVAVIGPSTKMGFADNDENCWVCPYYLSDDMTFAGTADRDDSVASVAGAVEEWRRPKFGHSSMARHP